MKQSAIITMLAALLGLGIPISGQETSSPAAQTPPEQSAPSQTSKEPATVAPPAPLQESPQAQPPASPAVTTPPAQTNQPTTAAKKKKAGTSGPARKVVVRNGGAKDQSAQLAPGMSKEQAARSRESTARLLAATDSNLLGIAGHALTPAQQNTLDQIHAYMRQSKEASDSGDLARAHTLAYKAHLLSDELKKQI